MEARPQGVTSWETDPTKKHCDKIRGKAVVTCKNGQLQLFRLIMPNHLCRLGHLISQESYVLSLSCYQMCLSYKCEMQPSFEIQLDTEQLRHQKRGNAHQKMETLQPSCSVNNQFLAQYHRKHVLRLTGLLWPFGLLI